MHKKTHKTRLTVLICCLLVAAISLQSCKDNNRHVKDLSGHKIELDIKRTEGVVFSLKSIPEVMEWTQRDTVFSLVYMNGIMQDITGGYMRTKEQNAEALLQFVQNGDMRHLYRTVDSTFHDFDDIEDRLNDAFSYFNYHFGDSSIPTIYTFVSPFYYNTVTFGNNLGIGLDMYLGPTFDPYYTPGLNFPQYKINKFRKNSIVADAVKSWLMSVFPKNDEDRRLISEMLYEGKILYALDALLPHEADSIKIGYEKGQIEWCRENELQVWDHLIAEELLYSRDQLKYRGVLGDGPFSKGVNVPQESSPRMSVWTGWQIVRRYMELNPEITLRELMQDTDYDKILRKSAYKPG